MIFISLIIDMNRVIASIKQLRPKTGSNAEKIKYSSTYRIDSFYHFNSLIVRLTYFISMRSLLKNEVLSILICFIVSPALFQEKSK